MFWWHHQQANLKSIILLSMRSILTATLVAFLPYFATTTNAQSLSGEVRSLDGDPVPGANIVLVSKSSGDIITGSSTNSEGVYTLFNTGSGEFLVTASFVGLARETRTVVLRSGDQKILDFILNPRTVHHPEMVVSAHRVEASVNPVTHSNLTAADLENMPSMKDLPIHLSTTPSITFYSENGNGIGYSTLRMRGFDQRRVAIAINGVPQNDPEEFNVFWVNFFDIQGVVRDIQIQRGASGAYYGSSGIGGAINIITGPYRPTPDVTIEAGGGSYATRQLSIAANSGIVGGKYRLFGRFSRLESDGYRDWSWTEFWRFFAGAQRISARSTITVQAFGGPQRDGLAYVGIPKAANKETIDDGFGGTIDRKYNFSEFTSDVEDFHQPHFEIHHDFKPTDSTTIEQTLFYIKGEGYFDFDGTFRSADFLRLPADFVPDSLRSEPLYISSPGTSLLFRAYLDQWQVGWYPRITHASRYGKSTLGVESRLHRSLRWGRIEESNTVPVDLQGDNDERVYQFHGEKLIGSILGSHVVRPTENVLVQGDLSVTWRQYRIYDEQFFNTSFKVPYTFVNPRVGVTVFPGRPTSLYASVAVTSREPRMKSLYDGEEAGAGFQPQFESLPGGGYDYDNPLVRPERMFNVEVGLNRRAQRYRYSANGFLMYFVDEIVPSGGLDQFGVPRTGNADETIHLGIESEVSARLLPGLDLTANIAVSRNRFIDFVEYDPFTSEAFQRKGNPIAGFPDVTGGLTFTYAVSGFTALVTSQYVGEQFIDNSAAIAADGSYNDEYRLSPYVLSNLTFAYRFPDRSTLRGLSASIDVNNITNSQILNWGNVSFGVPQFFPYAQRHVYAKLKYTLD